jgi:hypothetical protein
MSRTFTIEASGDGLPVFSARVTSTGDRNWSADYFRDGELIGNGLIGAGHDDLPIGVVKYTLESYRQQEQYWREHPEPRAPDRP